MDEAISSEKKKVYPFFFRLWQRLRITVWDETYESALAYAEEKWGDNNIDKWKEN